MPTWWADFRRATLCAVAVVVGCTLLLLLASTGLLRHNEGTGDVIAADATWAGILAGIGCVMYAFVQISSSRPDHGYRYEGLPRLLVLGVLVATLVDLAVFSVWPLIIGNRAAPDEVIATLVTNPLSFALVASFVLAMHACSMTCVLGFVRGGWKSSLAAALPLLMIIGLGIFQGTHLFGNPPTLTPLVAWSAVAALGLGVLAVVAALVGPDRPIRP